jgi:hypothetical protein
MVQPFGHLQKRRRCELPGEKEKENVMDHHASGGETTQAVEPSKTCRRIAFSFRSVYPQGVGSHRASGLSDYTYHAVNSRLGSLQKIPAVKGRFGGSARMARRRPTSAVIEDRTEADIIGPFPPEDVIAPLCRSSSDL